MLWTRQKERVSPRGRQWLGRRPSAIAVSHKQEAWAAEHVSAWAAKRVSAWAAIGADGRTHLHPALVKVDNNGDLRLASANSAIECST